MANEKRKSRDLGIGCLNICLDEAGEVNPLPLSEAETCKQIQSPVIGGYQIRYLSLNADKRLLHLCNVFGRPACSQKDHAQEEITFQYYEALNASSAVQCLVLTKHGKAVSQANIFNTIQNEVSLDYYALDGDFLLEIMWPKDTAATHQVKDIFLAWSKLLFSVMIEVKRLYIKAALLSIVSDTAAYMGFQKEKSYWKNAKEGELYVCTKSQFEATIPQRPRYNYIIEENQPACGPLDKQAAKSSTKRT